MKKIFFILFVFGTAAQAQQPLSLPEAINIALKKSFDIELAKNNLESSTIFNNYGVAGGLPVVSATASDQHQLTSIDQRYSDASRNTKKNNAGSNNLNANITASMLLYNGMRVVTTKSRLEQLQLQSEKVLNAQIQNTVASVMLTYFDIVRQQSYIKTIDRSIEVFKERLAIIQTQQNVGLANNADLFQAQLDLNSLEQSKNNQRLIVDQSKADLISLLHFDAGSDIVINDTIIIDNGLQLASFLEQLQNNADLKAAEDQVKINELIVKETAAQRYPSLRLNTGYNLGRTQSAAGFSLLNQSHGPLASLSVSIPIYNGSLFKRQQQVAEINIKNAQVRQQDLSRIYTNNAVKHFQSYSNALRQIETERHNYKLSQQLLDLVIQRFKLRQATIIDVKQAQQSFEDAGYRLVNLSFAAKAAEIELKRLANVLEFTP